MPTSLYRPSGRVIDWGDPSPSDNIVSVDLAAIQRKLNARRDDPRRWQKGTFRVPKVARPDQYIAIRTQAIKTWVRAMEKMGWVLRGRIAVYRSRFPATEIDANKVQEDMDLFECHALFEKDRPKAVRIELPDSLRRPTYLP